MDKLILVENFNLQNSKECFRLINLLKNSTVFPPVKYYGNQSLVDDYSKAEALNNFFIQVSTLNDLYRSINLLIASSSLMVLIFRSRILNFFRYDSDNSLATGSDNVPSFVLKSCSRVLASAVHVLFQSIKSNFVWPAEWKHCNRDSLV